MRAALKHPSTKNIVAKTPLRKKHPVPTQISNFLSPHMGNFVIQRKAGCPCGGGCPKCLGTLGIQAKLKIGAPNDKYEQEADRLAEQVMRMPEPKEKNTSQGKTNTDRTRSGLLAGNSEISIQQQETDLDEDEEEDLLQAKATPGRAAN